MADATLVLDLDKTLVYVDIPEDYSYGDEVSPHTVRRPGLNEFMQAMAAAYEMILVFSAAPKEYVQEIVSKKVDPSGSIVARSFSSEDMEWMQNPGSKDKVKVKDLRKLGRDLKKLVWLDDTPSLYPYTPMNGIAVLPFTGDSSDQELARITPLLQELAKSPDVVHALQAKRQGIGQNSYLI